MSNAVVQHKKSLGLMLKQNMKSIEALLPQGMDSARLCRLALNAVIKNPSLAKCKPETFLMAVMNCAETGLEPTLGQCAFVPFKGDIQFQPMYQGLIELARRSGQISTIYAEVVRVGDEFTYELGLEPKLVHKPVPSNEGALLYVYAVAKLKDGSTQFVVMDEAQVRKRQQVSKAGRDDAPWKSWEDEMWKKTALKALCKLLPKNPELARAVEIDNRAEAGKKTAPDGIDLTELAGVDLNEIAEVEGEDETPIEAPQRKGKKGKTVDAPAKELDGQDVSEDELADNGWGAEDELPM